MGTYYELRMTGKLSFKDKKDVLSIKIKKFLDRLIMSTERDRERLVVHTNMLMENSLCSKFYSYYLSRKNTNYEFGLHNNFTEDDVSYKIDVSKVDEDCYRVDYCMGNKNCNDNLELLTLLLADYMDDGFILVYYNEQETTMLNQVKKTLYDYNIKEDEYPDVFTIPNQVERAGVDEDNDIIASNVWLHSGLAMPITPPSMYIVTDKGPSSRVFIDYDDYGMMYPNAIPLYKPGIERFLYLNFKGIKTKRRKRKGILKYI